MFKKIAILITVFLLSAAPAYAGSVSDMNTACKLEINTQIPASFADSEVRFKRNRGAGRVKKITYSLTLAGERSDVLCLVSRNGVKEIRFEDSVQAQIADAR